MARTLPVGHLRRSHREDRGRSGAVGRSTVPGRAPVAAPSSQVGTPAAIVARKPARLADQAPRPVGHVAPRRVSRPSSISSRANTARSATMPGAMTPRSWSPKNSAGPAGEAVHGLLDADRAAASRTVVATAGVARARRHGGTKSCWWAAAVVDVRQGARLPQGPHDVGLVEPLGGADHQRADAVGEHPLGQRVGDVQAPLPRELLEGDADGADTGLGLGQDHLVRAVEPGERRAGAGVPVGTGARSPPLGVGEGGELGVGGAVDPLVPGRHPLEDDRRARS